MSRLASALSVLLVDNHPGAGGNPGYADALRNMVETGELAAVEVLYAGERTGENARQRWNRVAGAIRQSRCELLLVLSMKDLVRDMDQIEAAVAGRLVAYWEGDPWGPGKRVSDEMAAWLGMSDYVFSVGGEPQVSLLQRHGAGTVHHTIHTYDHVLFERSERGDWEQSQVRVAFLGRNLSRFPGLSGLPGSMGRWRLVASLKARYGHEFFLAGSGWPRSWGVGRVDFGEQDRFLQRAHLIANWDHFPRTEAYASDRLPIAMISGRPQVTTRHPGMDFLPDESRGLFLEPTVGGIMKRVRQLLNLPDVDLRELGTAGNAWARGRVSHREAIRHMLSVVVSGIERPPADPWDRLPGPWTAA